MGRFKVKIGSSFQIDELEVKDASDVSPIVNAAEKVADAAARAFVVRAVVGTGLLFLGGAAAIGVKCGDFAALTSLWVVMGPFAGAIAGHYFRVFKGTD